MRLMDRVAPALSSLYLLIYTLAQNLFSSLLEGVAPLPRTLAVLFAIAALIYLAIVSLSRRRGADIEVILKAPVAFRSAQEYRYARRGFVGLVSPMNTAHLDDTTQKVYRQNPELLDRLVEDRDYAALGLTASNLGQLIAGVCAHKPRLEHCWLVTTPGSQKWARLLEAYLKDEAGLSCKFHHGERYTVSAVGGSNDSDVVKRTYDVVKEIFQEARDFGLNRRDIVADITGAWKTMTFATILACLHKERDIQYVGAEYDSEGKPIRDRLTPLLFSFEPGSEGRDS